MALDPRLASIELLTLAALRARRSQAAAPRPTVTLQVVYYDASGHEPPEHGARYVYAFPTYERVPAAEGGSQWRLIPD
jgi:hypothetical protein